MLGMKMKLNSVRQRQFQKPASSLTRFLNFEFKPRKKVATSDHLRNFMCPLCPVEFGFMLTIIILGFIGWTVLLVFLLPF